MFGLKRLFKRAVEQSPFYVSGGAVFASESVDSALESVCCLFERVSSEVIFRVTKEGMPDPTHKISGLLLDPSRDYSRGQFFSRITRNLITDGNAFAKIGPANEYLDLFWRSVDVSASEDSLGKVRFYQARGNQFIPAEDLLHFRESSGSQLQRGRSKAASLREVLNNIRQKEIFLSKNAFMAKAFVKGQAALKSAEAKEFSADLQKFLESNAFSVMTLAGKTADLKNFSIDSKTQDFLMFREAIRRSVFQCYSIPLFLVSSEKQTSYKSASESFSLWIKGSFSGLMEIVSNEMAFKLLTPIERRNGLHIEADLSRLMKADRETETKLLSLLTGQHPVITIDDARKQLNLPPLPEGGDKLPVKEGMNEI